MTRRNRTAAATDRNVRLHRRRLRPRRRRPPPLRPAIKKRKNRCRRLRRTTTTRENEANELDEREKRCGKCRWTSKTSEPIFVPLFSSSLGFQQRQTRDKRTTGETSKPIHQRHNDNCDQTGRDFSSEEISPLTPLLSARSKLPVLRQPQEVTAPRPNRWSARVKN